MTKKASKERKFCFSATICHTSSGLTLGTIYFDDVISLKHWFNSLSNEYLCINDIYLNYE